MGRVRKYRFLLKTLRKIRITEYMCVCSLITREREKPGNYAKLFSEIQRFITDLSWNIPLILIPADFYN